MQFMVMHKMTEEMEKDGRIKRKVFHETPVRIEYTITKGRGASANTDQMAEFSVQFCAKDAFKDGRERELKEVHGREYIDSTPE